MFLLWQKHWVLLSWVPWPLFFPCHCRPGLSALLSCIIQVWAELSKGVYFVPDGEGNGVREFSPYKLVTHWMYCDLQKHVWPGRLIYKESPSPSNFSLLGYLWEKKGDGACAPWVPTLQEEMLEGLSFWLLWVIALISRQQWWRPLWNVHSHSTWGLQKRESWCLNCSAITDIPLLCAQVFQC